MEKVSFAQVASVGDFKSALAFSLVLDVPRGPEITVLTQKIEKRENKLYINVLQTQKDPLELKDICDAKKAVVVLFDRHGNEYQRFNYKVAVVDDFDFVLDYADPSKSALIYTYCLQISGTF